MKLLINQERIQELHELDEDGSNLVLNNLITLFLTNLPDQIEKLNLAFENGDYTSMKSIAHSISGSCLDLGADRLSEICRRIETHGAEEKDLAGLASLLNDLRSCFFEVNVLYLELKKSLIKY